MKDTVHQVRDMAHLIRDMAHQIKDSDRPKIMDMGPFKVMDHRIKEMDYQIKVMDHLIKNTDHQIKVLAQVKYMDRQIETREQARDMAHQQDRDMCNRIKVINPQAKAYWALEIDKPGNVFVLFHKQTYLAAMRH